MEGCSATLMESMGSDLTVVNRARASFAKDKKELDADDVRLIEYLATGMRAKERGDLEMRIVGCTRRGNASDLIDRIQAIAIHFAPFCHVVLTFRLRIPIFLARQLFRSGVGFAPPLSEEGPGYSSEESRRYVDSDPEFFGPVEWRQRAADVKQGSGGPLDAGDIIATNGSRERYLGKALSFYREQLGCTIAPEQARIDLPQSMMTTIDHTGSLYAWARVCRLRADAHAQKEWAAIVEPIRAAMLDVAPVSTRALLRLEG